MPSYQFWIFDFSRPSVFSVIFGADPDHVCGFEKIFCCPPNVFISHSLFSHVWLCLKSQIFRPPEESSLLISCEGLNLRRRRKEDGGEHAGSVPPSVFAGHYLYLKMVSLFILSWHFLKTLINIPSSLIRFPRFRFLPTGIKAQLPSLCCGGERFPKPMSWSGWMNLDTFFLTPVCALSGESCRSMGFWAGASHLPALPRQATENSNMAAIPLSYTPGKRKMGIVWFSSMMESLLLTHMGGCLISSMCLCLVK